MKKAWMLLLSLLMVLGTGMASASSRSDAMSADINVVEDYDLIFTYPNKALEYKNTVDYRLEYLDYTGDDYAGILDGKFTKLGVIGVYMNRPNNDIFDGYSLDELASYNSAMSELMYWRSNNGYPAPGNPLGAWLVFGGDGPYVDPLFDLFWAKQMGNMGLGVKLSYAENKDNSTYGDDYTALDGGVYSDKHTWEARQLGLELGLGLKNLGPFEEANISAGYAKAKVDYSYTQSSADHITDIAEGYSIKDDGIYSANVNINLKHDLDENNNIKLFAGFDVDNFGLRGVDGTGWTAGYGQANSIQMRSTQTMTTLGLGFNHTVNEGAGLVSGGLKVEHGTWKDSAGSFVYGLDTVSEMRTYGDDDYEIGYTWAWTYVPAFVSVEAKVKSWLTLRSGAEATLWGTETDGDNGAQHGYSDSYSYSSNFSWSAGFGLNWKNFTLDGVLNTEALQQQIASVQPGRGLLFDGNLVTVYKADLKYKF
jgi:hypothetical protein